MESGDIDVILNNLNDPFQSNWPRQYHIDALESVSRRPRAIQDILNRKSKELKTTHNDALDYTQYNHPLTSTDLVKALFPSTTFSDIPEDVKSPLCAAFWPVLRLIAIPGTATWNDIFSGVGYTPSEELRAREFGTHHLDTGALLRLVSDIITACPAKVSMQSNMSM